MLVFFRPEFSRRILSDFFLTGHFGLELMAGRLNKPIEDLRQQVISMHGTKNKTHTQS
jgi:hypothetical protein